MPIVNRLDFLLHYPSAVLCGKYLNEVPVLVMCPLQPKRSDMQNGTDLLRRQKKETKQMSNCVPLNWDWGRRGGGLLVSWGVYAKFMCVSVSVRWQGLMRASRCVKTHVSVLMRVRMCVCVCNYQLHQTLLCHNYLPLSTKQSP